MTIETSNVYVERIDRNGDEGAATVVFNVEGARVSVAIDSQAATELFGEGPFARAWTATFTSTESTP